MRRKGYGSSTKVLIFALGLFTIGTLCSDRVLAAAQYPAKPVELVLCLDAGGQTDVAVRILGDFLQKKWGQPVVVVNKPGAGGMLGASYLAKAAPDGYTIASMGDAQQITAFILHKPPYKLSDLKVVCQWGYHNTSMAVPSDSPFKTMKEFIEYAKKNPGVKYGHHRKGSSPWMQSQYLINEAGIKMDGVSFNGDPGVLTALLGKHVPIGTLGYVTARAQKEAGKIRMLMTFSPDGIEGEPDLPTLAQVLGKKDARIYPPSMAIFVPAGTPAPIVSVIHKAVKEITADKEFREKMKEMGIGVKYADEAEYEARRVEMHEKVRKIMLEGGLIKE